MRHQSVCGGQRQLAQPDWLHASAWCHVAVFSSQTENIQRFFFFACLRTCVIFSVIHRWTSIAWPHSVAFIYFWMQRIEQKNVIAYQWYPVNQCDLRHFFIPRQIFDSIRPNDQLSVKPASLINVLLNLHSMHTAVRLYFKSIQHLPLIFPAEPGSHKQDTLQVPALHDVCRYTFHSSCCFCYERLGGRKRKLSPWFIPWKL